MAGKGKGKAPAAAEAGTSNGGSAQPSHPPPSEEGVFRAVQRALTLGGLSQRGLFPAEVRAKAASGATAQADMVETHREHLDAIQSVLNDDTADADKIAAVQAELVKAYDTNDAWAAVVYVLINEGPARASELARALGLSKKAGASLLAAPGVAEAYKKLGPIAAKRPAPADGASASGEAPAKKAKPPRAAPQPLAPAMLATAPWAAQPAGYAAQYAAAPAMAPAPLPPS